MLNEEVAKYRELSGDTNPNTPISRIGGYLDGYEKALEQEPCDDVVSRQAVLDEAFEVDTKEYGRIEVVGVDAINSLPAVNPQPKTGHWIEDEYEMEVRCSACGEANDECSRYCPNCGAKMFEPQESEDKE